MNLPQIIPVAGGKGGIGKSLVAVNIAVSLAGRGNSVVAADLDLGASNLHVLLGIRNSQKNILKFADEEGMDLDRMVLATDYRGVGLICGAANVAGASNLSAKQKMRILHSIETLSCDYVILDLGAGSSFNVTDFFLVGRQGIIVVAPEITSVLDAYSMLKSTLHRKLQMEWQSQPEIAALIAEFRNPDNPRKMSTVEHLLSEVNEISTEKADRMRLMVEGFGVRMILNKVRSRKDFRVADTLQNLSKKNLSLSVINAGFLPFDEDVSKSVNRMVPFVHLSPESYASRQMNRVSSTIARCLQAN